MKSSRHLRLLSSPGFSSSCGTFCRFLLLPLIFFRSSILAISTAAFFGSSCRAGGGDGERGLKQALNPGSALPMRRFRRSQLAVCTRAESAVEQTARLTGVIGFSKAVMSLTTQS